MIAAIVLAAGLSTRMGRPKQTLLLDGEPMLQRVLGNIRGSKVDQIVVVLGAGSKEVEGKVRFRDETVVFNAEFRQGMSSSLRAGLGALGPDTEAVIVVLGDQPYVSAATIDKLVRAYETKRAKIVAPLFRGRRGNPVLFDRSLFGQMMKVRGDRGARSVVEGNAGDLLEVEVGDGGILLDIDEPEDAKRGRGGRATQTRSRESG